MESCASFVGVFYIQSKEQIAYTGEVTTSLNSELFVRKCLILSMQDFMHPLAGWSNHSEPPKRV